MARTTKLLPSFSLVAPGSTATLQLPLGRTFDKIHVQYAGVTLAQMKNIRVEVNGKAIVEYHSAVELTDFNKRLGHNVEAGVIDFNFKRDEMKTLAEARYFGLGTASFDSQGNPFPDPINGVVIKMDIDAAATAPTLTATAILSNAAPIGMITKVKNIPISLNPGINQIDKILRPVTGSIAAIHIVTAADIEEIDVEMDSIRVYEAKTPLAEKIQRDHGRVPQASMVSADFVLEGDPAQALTMAGLQDFRVLVHANSGTTPGTLAYVFVEYFDVFAGI